MHPGCLVLIPRQPQRPTASSSGAPSSSSHGITQQRSAAGVPTTAWFLGTVFRGKMTSTKQASQGLSGEGRSLSEVPAAQGMEDRAPGRQGDSQTRCRVPCGRAERRGASGGMAVLHPRCRFSADPRSPPGPSSVPHCHPPFGSESCTWAQPFTVRQELHLNS